MTVWGQLSTTVDGVPTCTSGPSSNPLLFTLPPLDTKSFAHPSLPYNVTAITDASDAAYMASVDSSFSADEAMRSTLDPGGWTYTHPARASLGSVNSNILASVPPLVCAKNKPL